MSRVWDCSKASGNELLVLLALADRSSDEGICWPAIPTLARKARIGDRSVRRILRKLVESGDLVIQQSKGGAKKTNLYFITCGVSKETLTLVSGLFDETSKRRAQFANNPDSRVQLTLTPESGDSSLIHQLKQSTEESESILQIKSILEEVSENSLGADLEEISEKIAEKHLTSAELRCSYEQGGIWYQVSHDGLQGRKPNPLQVLETFENFRLMARRVLREDK
jgi:hypothetical protein